MSEEMRIDAIRIGERHRKYLGNLEALAQSIADVGLLHPVVVTPDGMLIAGQRRLAAVSILGWADVPVRVIDIEDIVLGERAENMARLDFTPTEAVAIGRTLEEREAENAKARMEHANNTYGNLPQVTAGPTRDKIGAVVGMSGKTYDKASQVVEAAEREPDLFGDLPEMMDDKSVDKAYKEIAKRERDAERKVLAETAQTVRPSDRWKILHGDIATVDMYGARFDFIITDPPYLKEYLPLYETLAIRALEWLKPDGLLIAMCGQSYLDQIVETMCRHLSYYWTAAYLLPGQPTPLRQRQVNCSWKPLLIFGPATYHGKIFGDVFKSDANDKSLHKWGQSESGMFSIVSQICLPGQSILDPFCGAGTTGVAALKHGCLFSGIDIDEDNVNLSIGRLAQ